MLKQYALNQLSESDIRERIQRSGVNLEPVFELVKPIISDVKKNGDEALRRLTLKYDSAAIQSVMIPVRPESDIPLDDDLKQAFKTAYKTIHSFHSQQLATGYDIETATGVWCSRVVRPIESVGLYVPGGTAVLPSSVLMLAIPATIAACRNIVLATPPRPDGTISPEVEYAAALCSVPSILAAGGAQAIAAMAYGTETVPKVDKILGPGNQYVTAAKMLLQNSDAMVSIDMPAGPSEVLVIADGSANPAWVASDLLSQAEHGADSQCILVAVSGFDLKAFESELENQLQALPRAGFARTALANSYILTVASTIDAVGFSNRYAPEHLIMNTADAEELLDAVHHAGSVFLGPYTPESMGDYASGTNHTLPTSGYARMYSGVSVDTFRKHITVQKISRKGLETLGPVVQRMARAEGLEGHRNAVTIRLYS